MPPPRLADLPLSPALRQEIGRWLHEDAYAGERAALEAIVERAAGGDAAALAELADAFAGPLPIGTGGRRGRCGCGPNRMNQAVLRETAAGLLAAIREQGDPLWVAVVYDTRRSSREFAYLVAAQLVAGGARVLLVDAPRPTPLLSYLVRQCGCGAGVVISASHNPPEDNGIKIYGPDGAQVLADRDARLMREIRRAIAEPASIPAVDREALARWELPRVDREALAPWELPRFVPPSERGSSAGMARFGDDAGVEVISRADGIDRAYGDYVATQGVAAEALRGSGLAVAYSPLHGVGHHVLVPLLRRLGVTVHVVERQCDADGGNFSTVASANPESPPALDLALALAREHGADLVLATDPDADRLGACVRDRDGAYHFIDGNRLGVLMVDHVLGELAARQRLPPDGWVLTTLVSSPLVPAIAKAHGVAVVDDLLVGFKHHAGMMAESDRPMLFACEESHGYLRGNEIRDKDGAIAALLLCECAAIERLRGRTLLDRLEEIWARHGYHRESTRSLYAEGAAGRAAMAALMSAWRTAPPRELAGMALVSAEDRSLPRRTGSPTRDLPGDVLCFEYAAPDRACRVVLRPSGTEPKAKLYVLARGDDPAQIDRLVEAVLASAEEAASAVMAAVLARPPG